MSNIPKARSVLSSLADDIEKQGLSDEAKTIRGLINNEMHRRKAARRMPVSSMPISQSTINRITDLAESTDMHSSEIATEVGVNPGRVSEVLQGDR